jgi:hypothetical protein
VDVIHNTEEVTTCRRTTKHTKREEPGRQTGNGGHRKANWFHGDVWMTPIKSGAGVFYNKKRIL